MYKFLFLLLYKLGLLLFFHPIDGMPHIPFQSKMNIAANVLFHRNTNTHQIYALLLEEFFPLLYRIQDNYKFIFPLLYKLAISLFFHQPIDELPCLLLLNNHYMYANGLFHHLSNIPKNHEYDSMME